jgi:hypothetical protein
MVAGSWKKGPGVDFAVAGTVMLAGGALTDISASRNSKTLPRSDLVEGCAEKFPGLEQKEPIALMKTEVFEDSLTGGTLLFLMNQ